MNKDKHQFPIYKIVLLGETKVGKTSMINQFINNHYTPSIEETSDVREFIKLVNLNKDSQTAPQYCILKIVDLFGVDHPDLDKNKKMEDILKRLTNNEVAETKETNPLYCDKKIYGYMFVYDLTEFETLKGIIDYIQLITDKEKKYSIGASGTSLITKKMLVGNKAGKKRNEIFKIIMSPSKDLYHKDKEKFIKIIREVQNKNFMEKGIECSAAENINITEVLKCFEDLARAIYKGDAIQAYELEQENIALTKEILDKEKIVDEAPPKKVKRKRRGLLGCDSIKTESSEDEVTEEKLKEILEKSIDTEDLPDTSGKNQRCWLF